MSSSSDPPSEVPVWTHLTRWMRYLLLYPVGLLLALYVLSLVLFVSFGTLIFVLPVALAIAVFSASGWGRRAAAATPIAVLVQQADRVFVEDVAAGRSFELPVVTRVAVTIAMATAFGWTLLIASCVGLIPYL